MERQLTDPANMKSKDDKYRNRLRKSRSLGSLPHTKYAAKHHPDTVKWERGQFTWSMTQSASKHHYNERTDDRSHNYKSSEIRMEKAMKVSRRKSEIPGYNHYLEHHGTLPFICWIAMCCGLCIPCCCFCCEYFEDYNEEKSKHANICNRDEADNDMKPLLVATNEQIAGKQPTVTPISNIAYSSYQSVENGHAN